jgi:hypothetical protein
MSGYTLFCQLRSKVLLIAVQQICVLLKLGITMPVDEDLCTLFDMFFEHVIQGYHTFDIGWDEVVQVVVDGLERTRTYDGA